MSSTQWSEPADFWSIRNGTAAGKVEATAAAKRAGRTVAEWLGEAVREKIAREREPVGMEVLAPSVTHGVIPGVTRPDEIMACLDAYARVRALRGRPVPPNSRLLIACERALRAQLGAER